MERWTAKARPQGVFGEIMKIGDLVTYGRDKPYGVGVVVNIHSNAVIRVLWSNGVESCHSGGWLVPIKGTLEDT